METVKRIILGTACVLISVFAPYWIYAIMHDVDTTTAPPHYEMTAVAAAISFAIFCAFRLIKRTQNRAGCFGTLASYAAVFLVFFTISMFDKSSEMMWWPIMIPVGALYLAPLVVLTFIGSMFIIKPKHAGPGAPQGGGSPDP